MQILKFINIDQTSSSWYENLVFFGFFLLYWESSGGRSFFWQEESMDKIDTQIDRTVNKKRTKKRKEESKVWEGGVR